MANVIPRAARRSPRSGRGQLLLVTALGLAILFVTLALIVNTAIYTENLATRGSDIGGGTEAVRYHDTVNTGVADLVTYANDNENVDHSSIQTELENGVAAIDTHSGRQFSSSGRVIRAQLVETVNGTRIAQTDDTRNFSDRNGVDERWSVVTQVSNTRAFEITVTDETALEASGTGHEFQVVLEDGDNDQWILEITNDGTSTSIGITNVSGPSVSCTADTATPTINVTAGTVDGEACDGLELAEGLDTPYEISIVNGGNITGTYTMIVDNPDVAVNAPTTQLDTDDGGDQPFAAHAVYSAEVMVVYETPRLFYNTTVRVAPDEADG